MQPQNSLVQSPEIILLDYLKYSVDIFRKNYINSVNKDDSLLSKLFKGISLQKYNYLDQLVSVLITNSNNPRHLNIDMMLNMKKDHFPSVYISLGEESITNGNGIGLDQGYFLNENHDIIYSRIHSCNYQIIMMSDNTNEIILLYHFFKSLMISITSPLSMAGLLNLVISGRELSKYPGLSPNNAYMRIINLRFDYHSQSIDIFSKDFIENAQFHGIPYL